MTYIISTPTQPYVTWDKPGTRSRHNCRRRRLRCDRSYPACRKCTNHGEQCLGYGKLFRWTNAVASRGKLAGQTLGDNHHRESAISIRTSSPDSAPVNFLKNFYGTEATSIPFPPIDPILQDLGFRGQYYVDHCKMAPPYIFP